MEAMKISLSKNGWMRTLVSTWLKKMLLKNTGCNDIEVYINNVEIETVGEKVQFHLDVDGQIGKDDLVRLMKGSSTKGDACRYKNKRA